MSDNGYLISGDKALLCVDRIYDMLSGSYWAQGRSRETISKSIENSLCWGAYIGGEQVGFVRAVTDYATIYWLCDVIVDERHRGHGLGKKLVEHAVNSKELVVLRGILATRDAHGLYEQYGFVRNADRFMVKP